MLGINISCIFIHRLFHSPPTQASWRLVSLPDLFRAVYRPILTSARLCGAVLFLDDLGLLVPWPPYPLKLTVPTQAHPCLPGERSQVGTSARMGDPALTGDPGEVAGTTSGTPVAKHLVHRHSFAHTCVPDPVSRCGNNPFQSVSQ